MARFVCRNYGPSRQIPFKGQSLCLSNDQAIETDDPEEAHALGAEEDITVTDRGVEFATSEPPEKSEKNKDRPVTVDDAEAVHSEKFPDEDESQEVGGTEPPAPDSKPDTGEIAYEEMTVRELQVLAKDRTPPIKTSGLKKAELIQALKDYDADE